MASPGFLSIAALLLLAALSQPLALGAIWGTAYAFGLRPTQAQLFCGPILFRISVGAAKLSVGCIPITAFVTLPGVSPFEETPTDKSKLQFWQLSRWAQMAIALACASVLTLTSVVLLGPERAVSEIGQGFTQILLGALHPSALGARWISAWQGLVLPNPPVAAGVVLSKMVALELLPIGSAASLRAVFCFAGWTRRPWTAHVQLIAFLLSVPVLFSWLTALGMAVTRTP